MAVIRAEKKDNYTVVSNSMIRDERLSLKAKGLMTFILSLPDDWDYNLEGLAHMNKDGIYAVREAVKELESYGYIIRKRVRKEGRLGGAEYTIVEEPCIKTPHTVKPCTDSPILDEPMLEVPTSADLTYGNRRLLSKDKQSKDKSNTEYIKYGLNKG